MQAAIALKWKEQTDPWNIKLVRHRVVLRLAQGGVPPPSCKHFVRFIDGDEENCAAANLSYVELSDALQHVQDWSVDWSFYLTEAERAFVVSPANHDGLLAAFDAKLKYQPTRTTAWEPDDDGVEIFPICELGHEFCRVYSRADKGPLACVTLVALNVPKPKMREEDSFNVGTAVQDVAQLMYTLHCRAAQGITVKETQMLTNSEEDPELSAGFLLLRPLPADEARLREDLCCQMSEAFVEAEAEEGEGEGEGEAKIIVILPLASTECKNDYFQLLAVVSDLINNPPLEDSGIGLSGSQLGGGIRRQFRYPSHSA